MSNVTRSATPLATGAVVVAILAGLALWNKSSASEDIYISCMSKIKVDAKCKCISNESVNAVSFIYWVPGVTVFLGMPNEATVVAEVTRRC